jgi:phytanoyl-CoA dioxygenase PhyH
MAKIVGTPWCGYGILLRMVDSDAFIRDGFAKLDEAAPRDVADAARQLIWRQIGLSPDDPDTWTQPVVWAVDPTGEGPFGQMAASARLADALNELCGKTGWVPRGALGQIPVRFPVRPPADDRGWHIDLNTPLPDGGWAVSGRPHTMLLLTLLSEVGPEDAPTRIRVGSHRDVATALGEEPMDFLTAGPLVDEVSAGRPIVQATGLPGDMYLVHPFTVHAADENCGSSPRFMSQAPIFLAAPLSPKTPSALACVWP